MLNHYYFKTQIWRPRSAATQQLKQGPD